MTGSIVRQKYLDFFKSKNHIQIAPAPLVLEDDPTTLFTSSGMQPLVPYLMGEPHPEGNRLVDSQPSIRTVDIDEVGDGQHLTFFEMLGNWSLGDYFKKEQLPFVYEFFTKELSLPKERIWVTVFEGDDQVPKDEESVEIWKGIGIPEKRIFYYDAGRNWWSRTGTPEDMPVGEIGGPDSEVFFEFTNIPHDPKYGKTCHPNCQCGRFIEIGNSVFIQYKKVGEGKLTELPQKNVDFGGGLERITAAVSGNPDVYLTDLFKPILTILEDVTGKKYEDDKTSFRIIADHLKASVFLIKSGIHPGNKQHGYVLRRLIRRFAYKMNKLVGEEVNKIFPKLTGEIVKIYEDTYMTGAKNDEIHKEIGSEIEKFYSTLSKGEKFLQAQPKINATVAFNALSTYGIPLEVTQDIAKSREESIDIEQFEKEFDRHKELSRTTSAGVFKGGLADHSPEVVRLHTATHLLLAALKKVLGESIMQMGQNITKERSRFDFPYPNKLADKELNAVESWINNAINEDLPVNNLVLPKSDALKTGATHAFNEKYTDTVKVYFVGDSIENAISKEFCGGPHVASTSEIGHVKIKKQEKIGANLVRMYLTVD